MIQCLQEFLSNLNKVITFLSFKAATENFGFTPEAMAAFVWPNRKPWLHLEKLVEKSIVVLNAGASPSHVNYENCIFYPISAKFINLHPRRFSFFGFSPTSNMLHVCIMLYWTPLIK